jgi:hypothetical protein
MAAKKSLTKAQQHHEQHRPPRRRKEHTRPNGFPSPPLPAEEIHRFLPPTPRPAPRRPAYLGTASAADAMSSSHWRSTAATQSRPTLQIWPLRSRAPPSTGRTPTTCKLKENLDYEAIASPSPLRAGITGESDVGSGRCSLELSKNCSEERESARGEMRAHLS